SARSSPVRCPARWRPGAWRRPIRPTCSEPMPPSDPAIAIAGLNHWFGRGEARKQAIFDISLSVARGSLTALMGPSGSGKTTLLTLMGCLRDVQDGSIRLLGHELANAPERRLVALRRRLGFIFQAHNLHESLTARQNVLMGLQVKQPRDRT